ncbi:hypothetical protein KUTeg_007095 [Tegillarca granosa]|uniref:Uncharacterized protein n=1 Tax=Tegillarca granosa TaxID=220873 RepID=A0ABQ9FC89_TEGGR|nr:hypothetical protein KUTeg_007095 [Tegillarca granosa]
MMLDPCKKNYRTLNVHLGKCTSVLVSFCFNPFLSPTNATIVLLYLGKPEDVPDPSISLLCIQRTASPDDPRYFNYHSRNDTSIHLTIWPEADGDVFEVYLKYQDYPNATYYDYKTTIPKDKSEFPGCRKWRETGIYETYVFPATGTHEV